MKITLEKLYALNKIYEKLENNILPLKIAYKIAKHKESFMQDLIFYQNEQSKLFNTYLKKDANNNFIKEDECTFLIKDGKQEEFNNFFKELNNLEISLKDISFTFDELENLNLSLKDIELLLPFIEEK